jgi:hypothetical protein
MSLNAQFGYVEQCVNNGKIMINYVHVLIDSQRINIGYQWLGSLCVFCWF